MNTPTSADFDLSSVSTLGNLLLERVDAMREVDPIYWSEKNQAWFVTGHAQAMEGLSGNLPLSACRLPFFAAALVPEEERRARLPYLMSATKHWLLNMDAPEHPRLRRLMTKAFSKPVVEGLRPHVRAFIGETLDDAGGKEEVEFVSEVARRIPARTILRQLGLSDDLVPRLHHWSIILNTLGNVHVPLDKLIEIENLLLELRGLFMPEIEARRAHPREDFLSALVTANEAGDQLSEEEMLGICYITLIAGHDTTANTIALGTAALAQHPAACQYIRENPQGIGAAVMELSRYVAMSTAQARLVSEDFNWHGHEIKKGQFALIFIAGANRDPTLFANPEQMDFSRRQDANMTFGPGVHHCIGHLLAKMQLGEFFPELVRRFDPEMVEKRLDFATTLGFRGLNTLPIRLRPRR
jgi:pimeloyl-[acyl-carrier protein] synthase